MSRLVLARESLCAPAAEENCLWSPAADPFDNVTLYLRRWLRWSFPSVPGPRTDPGGAGTKPPGRKKLAASDEEPPRWHPQPIVPRSLALADAANLDCEIFRQLAGRMPWRESEFLNLSRIRNALRRKWGIHIFEWYQRLTPRRDPAHKRQRVEAAGWRFMPVSRSKWALDIDDPVDDAIIHRIVSITASAKGKQATIALLAHDGGYEPALRAHVEAGGKVILIGFAGSFSRRLYQLSYFTTADGRMPVTILDVEIDLASIVIPGRCELDTSIATAPRKRLVLPTKSQL